MTNGHRIGQVAHRAGVTPDTIRYYERLGVLPRPLRTVGGLRAYGDDVVARLRFIQQAQALGLTLKDVKALLADEGRAGQQPCRRVRDLLKARLVEVDARIKDLRAFRRTLGRHLKSCERALQQDTPVCPVLTELGGRRQ
ncbi:heavy metal-responsive transcriptional regulator [Luteitalea sp.]